MVAVLKAMNLPHEGNETEMTDSMLLQFKERRVCCLYLDELQHTVRSNTKAAFETVQDLLKSMLDIKDWPLHVVLSGMPKIEKMRDDAQIRRRSNVISFSSHGVSGRRRVGRASDQAGRGDWLWS